MGIASAAEVHRQFSLDASGHCADSSSIRHPLTQRAGYAGFWPAGHVGRVRKRRSKAWPAGTGPDGLLVRGERNGEELPRNTINKAWRRARAPVFTPEIQASPLAATPYDLRHAAVSTWLNAGIPAADVAEWAGHSVEVLLKIYAKGLDGGKHVLRQRIQRALGHGPVS